MKNDYILEQPFGRRRSRRWLQTLLAGLLFAISMTALMLSYQDADAQHPTSDGGDTETVVLSHPLAPEADALNAPTEAQVGTASSPSQVTTVPSVAFNNDSSPEPTATAAHRQAETPAQISSHHNTSKSEPAEHKDDLVAAASTPAKKPALPTVDNTVAGNAASKTLLDSVEAPESDADFDNPPSEAGGSDVDTRPPPMALDDDANWSDVTIKAGDSLSAIFSRNGLPANDWLTLAKNKAAKPLLNMRPGKDLQIRKTDGGRLAELVYPIDSTHTLRVTRHNEKFDVQVEKAALEHRRAYAQGQVKTSLYLAGEAAGLSPRQIMQLTQIFSWNIDFAREVRRGDRFTVIYNQIWHDGHKLRNGNIVAAEFTVHGNTFRAFRYADKSGDTNYYSADGSSLRRALERAPVKYRRISSPFNRHRMHPILHIVRPHLGVDYAAPTGTPVHAAGDGRIEFAGRKGGYGNVVVIRHNTDYETVYAHLHDFAHGIHAGVYVKQNRIIGHVGQTGLATGPHLHFGIRVDGRFENPRTVALPHASPVPKRYLAKFKRMMHPLLARLNELDRTGPRLASNH